MGEEQIARTQNTTFRKKLKERPPLGSKGENRRNARLPQAPKGTRLPANERLVRGRNVIKGNDGLALRSCRGPGHPSHRARSGLRVRPLKTVSYNDAPLCGGGCENFSDEITLTHLRLSAQSDEHQIG